MVTKSLTPVTDKSHNQQSVVDYTMYTQIFSVSITLYVSRYDKIMIGSVPTRQGQEYTPITGRVGPVVSRSTKYREVCCSNLALA